VTLTSTSTKVADVTVTSVIDDLVTSTIELEVTSTLYHVAPLCSNIVRLASPEFDTTLPDMSWDENSLALVSCSGFDISTNTDANYVNVGPNSV
jgi:hypothetical protein